jgi:hypothetical protein
MDTHNDINTKGINGPDDENSEPEKATESPFYIAVFDGGNTKNISDALNKANNITAWVKLGSPSNAYTIKSNKQTTPDQIREIFKKASNANVFVMEVNMKNYSWWLPRDSSNFFKKWINKNLD